MAIKLARGQGPGSGVSGSAIVRGPLLLSADLWWGLARRQVGTPCGSAGQPCPLGSPPCPPVGPPPAGGPISPPSDSSDRCPVPRWDARGHRRVLHLKAERLGILVQDCPWGGRKAAQGRVDQDVVGGVHHPACCGRRGLAGWRCRGGAACMRRVVLQWRAMRCGFPGPLQRGAVTPPGLQGGGLETCRDGVGVTSLRSPFRPPEWRGVSSASVCPLVGGSREQ